MDKVSFRIATPQEREAYERAEQAGRDAFARGLATARDRMWRQAFGLPPEPSPTTAATPGADLGNIAETLRRIRPVLYYAENEALTPRMVLHAPERPGWPEVIFCHPDDLPGLRARLPWLSLRPFREWSPRPEDIEAAFQEAIAAFSKDGG